MYIFMPNIVRDAVRLGSLDPDRPHFEPYNAFEEHLEYSENAPEKAEEVGLYFKYDWAYQCKFEREFDAQKVFDLVKQAGYVPVAVVPSDLRKEDFQKFCDRLACTGVRVITRSQWADETPNSQDFSFSW